jgi:hypothetical protein
MNKFLYSRYSMSVNNYIRIGYPGPGMVILTFDDRESSEIERVRLKVMEITSGSTLIGMWKRVVGLHFPIIGEVAPARLGSFLS